MHGSPKNNIQPHSLTIPPPAHKTRECECTVCNSPQTTQQKAMQHYCTDIPLTHIHSLTHSFTQPLSDTLSHALILIKESISQHRKQPLHFPLKPTHPNTHVSAKPYCPLAAMAATSSAKPGLLASPSPSPHCTRRKAESCRGRLMALDNLSAQCNDASEHVESAVCEMDPR